MEVGDIVASVVGRLRGKPAAPLVPLGVDLRTLTSKARVAAAQAAPAQTPAQAQAHAQPTVVVIDSDSEANIVEANAPGKRARLESSAPVAALPAASSPAAATTTPTPTQFPLLTSARPPFPAPLMDSVRTAVLKQGGFTNDLTPKTIDAVASLLRAEGVDPALLPGETLAMLRHMWLVQRCRDVHGRVMGSAADMAKAFEQNRSVVDLALKMDLPPVACMRAALSELGLNKNTVKRLVAGDPTDAMRESHAREIAELARAKKHDEVSHEASTGTKKNARGFELEIQRLLTERGVAFSTNLTSTAENPLTPDFLIKSEVEFVDPARDVRFRVHWIDAKDHWGGVSDAMFDRKAKAQALKYVESFGSGVLVYSQGVVAGHAPPANVAANKFAAVDVAWLSSSSLTASGEAAATTATPTRLAWGRDPLAFPSTSP